MLTFVSNENEFLIKFSLQPYIKSKVIKQKLAKDCGKDSDYLINQKLFDLLY